MVSVLSFYSNNPCLNPAGQGWPIFKNIVGKNEVLTCSKCGHYWWCRGECLPKGGTWFDSRHRLIFLQYFSLNTVFLLQFLQHSPWTSGFSLLLSVQYNSLFLRVSFFPSTFLLFLLSAICTKYTNGISLSLSSVNLTL